VFATNALQQFPLVESLDAVMVQTQEPQIPRQVRPALRMRYDVVNVKELQRSRLVAHCTTSDAMAIKKQGA